MNIRELREKRLTLTNEARALLDKADAEKKSLTAEQEAQWTQLMDAADELRKRIEQEERLQESEQHLGESAGASLHTQMAAGGDDKVDPEKRRMEAFRKLLPFWLTREQDKIPKELRALQQDLDISGGYLVPPLQFVQGLIQAVDNLVYVRQWATVESVVNADGLGAVSLDNDPADPAWTSELAIGTEDSTMSFGKRELHPHPLAKYIKISRKLIRSVPDVAALVQRRLAYKLGTVMENAYLNGTGAGQPLGVFVASALGISTGRDVSTGNTATSITFDGLNEAKYTLKPQYWPNARWLFHRDGQKQIAKLKDGEGQYIWRESARVGEPDRLLGLPTFMSEYAPNTFTTRLYVGILGDWKTGYMIADSLQMDFQTLVELYAAANQIGIVARVESDGMPVLEEAFVRVQIA